jgi:hypothetical protein
MEGKSAPHLRVNEKERPTMRNVADLPRASDPCQAVRGAYTSGPYSHRGNITMM